jgi:hypothetical protein
MRASVCRVRGALAVALCLLAATALCAPATNAPARSVRYRFVTSRDATSRYGAERAKLPAPALQPGVERVTFRADGGLSMRMSDGNTAYVWPNAYGGYTVSFPGTERGAQIWSRTAFGWRVTQTRRE